MNFNKLKQKWETRKQQIRNRSAHMRSILLKKGPEIFREYGIRKVYLFGSVQEGRSVTTSDIDLLVIPLPAEHYWTCWRKLEEMTGFPVDLYTITDDTLFVQKIMQRGELIYEI